MSDAESWIVGANAEPDAETYLITLANGTVIGGCGFDMRDGPAPEIGYWLGARYWGKGYATEAVRALIDHAFTDLEHKALQSSRARHQSGTRAACWRSAASSGPASACAASARSARRCRSTASGSNAASGPR